MQRAATLLALMCYMDKNITLSFLATYSMLHIELPVINCNVIMTDWIIWVRFDGRSKILTCFEHVQ